MEELLEVVTEEGNPTGEILSRDEIHNKNLLHNEIAVFVINKEGLVLLQKRAATKKSNPLCWGSSCAGHVGVSESLEEATLRELKEELGMDVNMDQLHILVYKKLRKGDKNSHIRTWYYVKTDFNISDFRIQKEELDEIRWFTIDEVISSVGDSHFTFQQDSLVAILRLKEILQKK